MTNLTWVLFRHGVSGCLFRDAVCGGNWLQPAESFAGDTFQKRKNQALDWSCFKHHHRFYSDLGNRCQLGNRDNPTHICPGRINHFDLAKEKLVALVPYHFNIAHPAADRVVREVVAL